MFHLANYLLAFVIAFVWSALTMDSASADSISNGFKSLREYGDQYRIVESVYLKAEAEIAIHPAGKDRRTGVGSFEYWADHNRYRIKCRVDPSLELMEDMDIAFDGMVSQMLMHGSGILSIQRGDSQKVITAFPNPIFLPFDFLLEESDACQACALRLPDLRDNNLWDRAAISAKQNPDGSLTIGRGSRNGRTYVLQLTFAETPMGRLPVRLEKTYASSDSKLIYEFGDFDNSASQIPIPRRIKSIGVESDGSRGTLNIRITTLKINEDIDQRAFKIDEKEAKHIWDADLRKSITAIKKQ